MDFLRRCWAEINLDNLVYNYKLFVNKLTKSDSVVIAVVKANAYGHGANEVSAALQQAGCNHFAVSNITEAVHLRKYGIKGQIMLLGYTPVQTLELALAHDITVTLHSLAYAVEVNDAAQRLGKQVKAYLKIDTGMGRIGFDSFDDNLIDRLLQAATLSNVQIVGAFAHFPVADGTSEEDVAFTDKQLQRFKTIKQQLSERGVKLPFCHHCNSAGGDRLAEGGLNAIRLGIALYGLTPYSNVSASLPLRPVMTLKTSVAEVKQIEVGRCVSYGRTYRATKPTRVATVTIGYADGYNRLLSNSGAMIIKGARASVIGRVTMDQTMLDVSDVNCNTGDEVTVFGEQGVTATDIANSINTINYEITCAVSARVPRIYIQNGKIISVRDNTY